MSDGDVHGSLAADLVAQAGVVSAVQGHSSGRARLATLESEHRELCLRRRRLHETIDLLSALPALKPDVAAMLATYRRSEREISWRRRDLYRTIGELRAEELRGGRDVTVS